MALPLVENENKETKIDIPEEKDPAPWQNWCIYKVPASLRKGNPEAYTPKLISIGPIHHGKPRLQQMEKDKRRYFHSFSKRLSSGDSEGRESRDLTNYRDFLTDNEKRIRSCYSEEFPDLSQVQLVDMIMLDTVFIMELFLRHYEKQNEGDLLFEKLWFQNGIEQDLILLENQVPFFTLTELYCLVHKQPPEPSKKQPKHHSFADLAHEYFKSYDPNNSSKVKIELQNWEDALHFTDMIRYFHIPHDLGYDPHGSSSGVLKNAVKLQEAGVSFEAVTERCLLDIKLKRTTFMNWLLCLGCFPWSDCVKSRLQIPQLKVDGTTEFVLRNLIALEQCHYPGHHYICYYVSVLDYLISGNEDVELLVEKDIIAHQLSSDKEVATMINGLCKEVVLKTTCNCYGETIKELNRHYNNCWKHFMGVIKWVYFRDPWRSSTTIVAVFVFLFAVVNFFRGIGIKLK